MTYVKHVTKTCTEDSAPLKRQKIAEMKNIRSVLSDKETEMFLKLILETNINAIFAIVFSTLFFTG